MTAKSRISTRAGLLAASAIAFVAGHDVAMAQTMPSNPTPPATSQDQAGTPGAEPATPDVVVLGYRASLQTALRNKRDADLPIESIAPEDIGKFPDQNVAESLQRLPGVQIDRSQGKGTAVLIDGLRQNLTTLNGNLFLTGKEFYVSGEAAGGGAGGNAQYNSLEGIPSEEIGGIDVYKNPKASMTEGGLGGTIDLKTRDPLAQPAGFRFGGNMRGVYAEGTGREGTDKITPNGTLVVSYRPSSRIAFTASVSYDVEDTHTKEYQQANRNQWVITNSATGPYTGALTPAGLSTLPSNQYYIDPQFGYFSDIFDHRKTLGASAGIALKIGDSITTRVNYFYSHEDESNLTYSDKVWFNGQGSSPGTLLPGIDPTKGYKINANGVVENAVFNANGAETQTLYQATTSRAHNVQWTTNFDGGGPFRATLGLAYARATSNFGAAAADVEHGLYLTSAGVATSPPAPGCNNGASTCAGAGNHGYTFNYSNGGTSGLPSVSYNAPYGDILTNPNYATFKSNWAFANFTRQRQYAIKADTSYDAPFLHDLGAVFSAGARFADRQVNQDFGRYLIDGKGAGSFGDPSSGSYVYYQDPGYGTQNIPYSTAVSNAGLVHVVNSFGVGNMIVKDPASMRDPATYLQSVWAGAGVPNTTEQLFIDRLSSFRVHEKTYAAYLMGDIGNRESRFHLNFGVRLVRTDLTIDNGQTATQPTHYGTAAWNGVDSNVVPVTTTRSYTDILPSFNFSLNLSDRQILRVSAARVVSPQDLFSLGLGNSFNFTRQTNARTNVKTGLKDGFAFNGGSSGNTQLDPYRATQALAGYENYFAPGALLSVQAFYKQIDNFVEVQNIATNVNDDFGGTTSNVTQPVNAGSGKVYGVELGFQYNFTSSILPFLDGFGVAANYTFSKSTSIAGTSFATKSSIPGVAENSVTGTLYYEHSGFSTRLSYSWRDKAVNDSQVGATFAFPDQNGVSRVYQVYSAPYGQLDGQVGYDINPHVGLVFQVQNITNEAQHTYLQYPSLPFTYDRSGRRFFFGIKFKG
jgi:TonB-dependent receptor